MTWALRGRFGDVVKSGSEVFLSEFDGSRKTWGESKVALGADVGDWCKSGSVVVSYGIGKVGILTPYVEKTDALAVAQNGGAVFGQGSEKHALPNENDLLLVGLGSSCVVSSDCVAEEGSC